MPLYIRSLPCKSKNPIVEQNSIPEGTDLYNPSRSGKHLYIRVTKRSATTFLNSAIIYNIDQKVSRDITSPWNLLKPSLNLFKGIEDLRIVEWVGKVWFAGTCTHASDHMVNDLIVGHFDTELSRVEKCCAVDIGSLPVKNVCPFVYENKLCLLDFGLMQIYELGFNEDEPKIYISKKLDIGWGAGLDKHAESKLRGSTSPVHLHGNLWGCVVHDIIFNQAKSLVTRLSYIHHWVEFDMSTRQVTFVSTPFWIAHWGIEYVSGIHFDKATNSVSLYFGVADHLPMQCETTLSNLRTGY